MEYKTQDRLQMFESRRLIDRECCSRRSQQNAQDWVMMMMKMITVKNWILIFCYTRPNSRISTIRSRSCSCSRFTLSLSGTPTSSASATTSSNLVECRRRRFNSFSFSFPLADTWTRSSSITRFNSSFRFPLPLSSNCSAVRDDSIRSRSSSFRTRFPFPLRSLPRSRSGGRSCSCIENSLFDLRSGLFWTGRRTGEFGIVFVGGSFSSFRNSFTFTFLDGYTCSMLHQTRSHGNKEKEQAYLWQRHWIVVRFHTKRHNLSHSIDR